MTNEEIEQHTGPEFYEDYHKNTPKTLTIGRHIITLSQIAFRFKGTVNLVEVEKGVSLEEFEIRLTGDIPLELVSRLHNNGYFVSGMYPNPKNNDVTLRVSANVFSVRNLFRGMF